MALLPQHHPHHILPEEGSEPSPEEIVTVLDGYKTEAQLAREGGPNPRDDVWEANWDRYWGRYDHSKKADWQSKHVMPEAPQFIDRWAAAMREALEGNDQWFAAVDETGESNEMMPHIERLMRILLGRCGVTPDGHRTDFSSVFEDQMKLGALMASCLSVTWKEDERGGWPSVESTDPREVWKDPKGRNMYRLRRYEIDKHELMALAELADENDEYVYNIDEIERLASQVDMDQQREKERSSGSSHDEQASTRVPIVLDEWVCDVLMPDGSLPYTNTLIVVANDRYIIRGPEPNPFWHGRDWVVLTPMISVPFSIYGRSYMEDWADVADAFIEMTNLVLDATYTSAIHAYAAAPEMLRDPRQLAEGVSPNTVFELEEGTRPQDFMKEIELGTLGADVVRIWQALKQEMREGAKLSEIALGQLPPNAHHTATAVAEVSQSGSAMIRSMARTIESRLLEPALTMVWQTALQHMDFQQLAPELGEEFTNALTQRREEFMERRIRFRVRGISGLIDRQSKLRNMLSMLQVVGQNEMLVQALMQRTSGNKLLNTLFRLFGLDPKDIELSRTERMIEQATGGASAAGVPREQGGQGGQYNSRTGGAPRTQGGR